MDELTSFELYQLELAKVLALVREQRSTLPVFAPKGTVAVAGSEPAQLLTKASAFFAPPKTTIGEYFPSLVATGDALFELGEYWAADNLCYCKYLRSDMDSTDEALPLLQSVELQTRATYGAALCRSELCKAQDPGVRFPVTLKRLVDSMRLVQQSMQEVVQLGSEVRERLYHLLFNGTVHIFSIADSLVTLGYGKAAVDYLNYSVLAMECTARLSTTKYLPWRVRLYNTICSCYGSSAAPVSALSAASRLRVKVAELRAQEEQDPPLPAGVTDVLDAADLAASARVLKYTIMLGSEDAAAHDPGTYVAAKLGLILDSKEPPADVDVDPVLAASSRARFESLLTLLRSPQCRSVHRDESADVALMNAAPALSKLCIACFAAEPALSPPLASGKNDPGVDEGEAEMGEEKNVSSDRDNAEKYLHAENTTVYSEDDSAASSILSLGNHVEIAKALFHLGQWDAFYEVAQSAARRVQVSRRAFLLAESDRVEEVVMEDNLIFEKEIELLLSLYSLEHGPLSDGNTESQAAKTDTLEESDHHEVSGASAVEEATVIDADATSAEVVQIENADLCQPPPMVAEVDGRIVQVSKLDEFASALLSCTRGSYRVVCQRRPDFLADAALRLWAPYCTAMLDTIGALSIETEVPEALFSVTTLALSAVLAVGQSVELGDPIIMSTASLRLGELLHSSRRQARKVSMHSRSAVQVIRSGLMRIEAARREFVDVDLYEETVDIEAMTLASITSSADFKKAAERTFTDAESTDQATLAALHSDLTAMLFRIELDLGDKNADEIANHIQHMQRQKARTIKGHSVRANTEPRVGESTAVVSETLANARAACEGRLLSECKRNHYARALLFMLIVERRAELHEKIDVLQEAAKELCDARAAEEALLNNAIPSAAKSDKADASSTNIEGHYLPPRPIIVSRTASCVTLRIVPFVPSNNKRWNKARRGKPPKVVSYTLYGKPAGAGTDVSINNTELIGTGVPVPADGNLFVTVDRLVTNESYVFASAAFDADGDIIGSIGETTRPVEALAPLPLLLGWGSLCKVAATVADEARNSPTVSQSNLALCEEQGRLAALELFEHFVEKHQQHALWAANPLDWCSLRKAEASRASRPVLQCFVQVLFAFSDLTPPAVSEVDSCNPHSPMVPFQVEALRSTQQLLIALEVATMLDDKALIMKAAARAYKSLVPLLRPTRRGSMALRALVSIQQVLRSVPVSEWNESTCSIYARVSHGLIQLCRELDEMPLAVHALMGTEPVLEAENSIEDAKIQIQPGSTDEQRALEAFMQLEACFYERGTSAIRIAAGSGTLESCIEPVETSEHNDANLGRSDSFHLDKLADVVWHLLAQPDGNGLNEAWEKLQEQDSISHPRYLELAAKLCRSAAQAGRHADASEWAEGFIKGVVAITAENNVTNVEQGVNADDRAGPTATFGQLVEDILLEESFDEDPPFTSVECHQYPNTENRDPLQLSLAENNESDSSLSEAVEEGADGTAVNPDETEEERREKAELEVAKIIEKDKRYRWIRLRQVRKLPTASERGLLINLAEFELVRAAGVLRLWQLVPAFVERVNVFGVQTSSDGPGTDLTWKLTDEILEEHPNATVEPTMVVQVPPLGIGKIEEDPPSSPIDAPNSLNSTNPVIMLDEVAQDINSVLTADRRARSALPELLLICSRAATRARWANSWLQLQKAGKILWNGLWYGWVSPEEFVTDKTEASEETSKVGSARVADDSAPIDSARSKQTNDEGDGLDVDLKEEVPSFDWKPVWRTSFAVLDMIEVVGQAPNDNNAMPIGDVGSKSEAAVIVAAPVSVADSSSESPSGTGDHNDNAAAKSGPCIIARLLRSNIDVNWASYLVSFTLQMLCSLKMWAELVSLGDRFNRLTEFAYAEPLLPIIMHAQRQLWLHSVFLLEGVQGRMTSYIEDWQEKHKKKKRRNQRKARALVKVEEKVTEAEKIFIATKAEYQAEVDEYELRSTKLKVELDRQQRYIEQISRDKNNCLEELHASRRLRYQALRHVRGIVEPASTSARADGVDGVGSVALGISSRTGRTDRTGRSSRRTRRTGRQTTGRTGRISNRSHRSRSTTATTQASLEWQYGEQMRGALFDAAVGAYTKAAVLTRQKQETLLMVQCLQELGDLQFARGGQSSLRAAERAWTDAVDGVVHEVDSPQSWRSIFASACSKSKREKSAEPTPMQILESFGMVGCALGGMNLSKIAQYAHAANYFQRQEHILMAASMFTAMVSATLPHPTRAFGFVAYTVKELWPGFELFSDPNQIQIGTLVASIRFVSAELISSGSSAQALKSLPLLAIYEYLCSDVSITLRGAVDARLLRAEVLILLGFVREASMVIASILKAEGLLDPGVSNENSSVLGTARSKDGAKTDAPSNSNLPFLVNHEMPWHPENIAGEKWLADELQQPNENIASLLGPELLDRLCLTRAKLLVCLASSGGFLQSVISTSDTSEEDFKSSSAPAMVINRLFSDASAWLRRLQNAHEPDNASKQATNEAASARSSARHDNEVIKQSNSPLPDPVFSQHSLRVLAECALLESEIAAGQGLHSGVVTIIRDAMDFQAREEPRTCATATAANVKSTSTGSQQKVVIVSGPNHPRFKWWLKSRLSLARCLLMQGRYKDADEQCKLGQAEARELNEVILYCSLRCVQSELHVHAGELDKALAILDDVIDNFAREHYVQDEINIAELHIFAAELRREQAAVMDLNSEEAAKAANALNERTVVHLETAERIMNAELLSQGWGGPQTASIKGSLSTALLNVYLKSLPQLATIQLLLGKTHADHAVRVGVDTRTEQRQHALRMIENGLATLKQSAAQLPSLKASLLVEYGRLQRLLLPQAFPHGCTNFPAPVPTVMSEYKEGKDRVHDLVLPENHPFILTAETLRKAVMLSVEIAGHDHSLMHAACMELFLLYGSRLVQGLGEEHGSLAIEWLRVGATTLKTQQYLLHRVSELSAEPLESIESLPERLRAQIDEACASSALATAISSPRSARSGRSSAEPLSNETIQISTRVLLYYFLALLREQRLAGPSSTEVRSTAATLHIFLRDSLPQYAANCALNKDSIPKQRLKEALQIAPTAICVQWYNWQPSYVDVDDAPIDQKWVWMLFMLGANSGEDSSATSPWIFRRRVSEAMVNELQQAFRHLRIKASEVGPEADISPLKRQFSSLVKKAELLFGRRDAGMLEFTPERAEALEHLFDVCLGANSEGDKELHQWLSGCLKA